MGKLDGKVAIVTGSSRSIGKAIAIGLAKEGADLTLAARGLEGLEATAEIIRGLGRKALVVQTDVMIEDNIKNMIQKTIEEYNRLDILVNNSGVFYGGPVDALATDQWDAVIATNLRAPFLCTREAFAYMKEHGGGKIINIGSISATMPRFNNCAYTSAKAGLRGLTHSTALEGREHGITASILHPGETARDMPPNFTPPPGMKMPPKVEGGEMTTEELAAAAVYIACCAPHVNPFEITQLPIAQPYLGRG
ncbi:MAG: SDR family oxidoreductase [Dehalococcoidales bacterium]|nr:SDR family oxidoreductase [Dehalococcoidales bacterium]